MAQTKISRLRVQDLGYQLLNMYRYNYKNQTTLQSHVLSSLHTPFTPPCTRHKMESTGKATRPRTVSKRKGLIEESFSRETTHFPLGQLAYCKTGSSIASGHREERKPGAKRSRRSSRRRRWLGNSPETILTINSTSF